MPHPYRGFSTMALLIRLNAYGTHADISEWREAGPIPADARLLQPGEAYFGIDYEVWHRWIGHTADILALQHTRGAPPPQIANVPSRLSTSYAPTSLRTSPYTRPSPAHSGNPLPVVTRLAENGIWDAEPALKLEPLRDSEYGYYTGEALVTCSRPELIAQCVRAPDTPRVWTPASSELVAPEHVTFLVEEYRRRHLRKSKQAVVLSSTALGATLCAYLFWLPHLGFRSMLVLLPAFLGVWLVVAVSDLRQGRSIGAEAFVSARQRSRHVLWIKHQPAVLTKLLLGCLAAVGLAQVFAPTEAIEAAGLVKSAVWGGEVWRLITAPMLHVNLAHFWMNAVALYSLGRLVESHSRREYFTLTFVSSALVGSIFSVLLMPNITSVGASGGVIGLIGFLGIFGYHYRDQLPMGFVQGVVVAIVATAAWGIVGYAIIDNAAHLGGLFGGAALAEVLHRRNRLTRASSPRAPLMEYAAGAIFLLLAGGSILAIIRPTG